MTASTSCACERRIPTCCLTCGNYRPQFYRVQSKECAAFGTVDGVKDDVCGAWCKQIDPNARKQPDRKRIL